LIYFIQADASRRIKIGTTIRLSACLKKLEAEYTARLEVLGVCQGGLAEEQIIKARFKDFATCDDWFLSKDSLMDFIRDETWPWDGCDEVTIPGENYKWMEIPDPWQEWLAEASVHCRVPGTRRFAFAAFVSFAKQCGFTKEPPPSPLG
jgi:hypothetical protein